MKPNILFANSTILKLLAFLILFLTTFPGHSHQQEIVSKSNIVEAHCMFSYDPQNRYNCYLFNLRTNATDILDITGEHMLNHTDSDVHGVIHTSSMINRFNGEVLRRFVNLRRIRLWGSFLHSINPSAFDFCAQLEELDIGANGQLLELPPRLLANCGNLRTFLATSSRFLTVPEDLFGNTRNLEVINFMNSRLTSLPDNLLRNMQNFRRFIVRGNQLSHLSPSNFISATNLEEIDLFFNHFNDTQAIMNLLNGHFGLRTIFLLNNPFRMFSLNFFTQFRNLQELGIGSRNNITGIEWQFLPSTLQILMIYGINEEIPENAFVGVPNLTYLDLSGYGITTLQPNTFTSLPNLDRLDIMGTHLTTLHPQLFTNQGRLRALHLSFNEIEELPEGVFAPLVNLGFNDTVHGLFMVGNRLRRLSANSFGQHPHLNNIFFTNNQIYAIQRGLFSRFNPRPALIDFGGNECIRWGFSHKENLDQNPDLEWCFNNYEGITTTTPAGAASIFKRFEVIAVIFIGFLNFFKNC
jgi:Leucine-rich repeat (LRR) protein